MLLSLQAISKRYEGSGGSRVALDDVTLELERGQIMGVFGPSGSGKTTLLRIAAGLTAPDSGAILYDGERLDRMPTAERMRLRRREIACIWSASAPSQERLRALDHVSLPLLVDGRDHRSALRRAREALLACEAEHCAGMELHELSDGERQRVEIARALVIEPRLLLADGPACSLSLVEQEAIMVLLSSLAHEAKVAVLIADSDTEALIRANPILYLHDGKLLSPEPDRGHGNVYRFPAHSRRVVGES
jgi:putative ABC transport system ATP-binding protein